MNQTNCIEGHTPGTVSERSEGNFIYLEHLPLACTIEDLSGKIIYTNRAFELLIGLKKHEALNYRRTEFLSKKSMRKVDLLMKSATGSAVEAIIYHTSGYSIPVKIHSTVIQHNGYCHIQTSYTDIRDLKEMEKKRKQGSQLYSMVTDAASEGILITVDKIILQANKALTEMLGYKANEIENKSALDFIDPEYHPVVEDHIRKNYDQPYEVTGIKQDGSRLPLEICGKTIMYHGVKARVTCVRDLTTAKQLQAEKKKAEYKLAALMEHGSQMLGILDWTGNYEYASPAVERILGYQSSELEGRNALEFIHPDDQAIAVEALVNIPGSEMIKLPLFRFRNSANEYRWIECTVVNHLSNPEINAILASSVDVTERVQYEEQLKAQNIELKKINYELDSFVYRASHDLRSPLTSIRGLINVARLQNDLDEIDNALSMIEECANKLDNFILEIANYSRNSRLEIESVPVDFDSLVNEVYSELSHSDDCREIEFSIDIDKNLDYKGDKLRLKIILSNLVSNSIKYRSRSSSQVPFIKVNVTKSNDQLILAVEDNGMGIDHRHIPRVFDMFYRATESSRGTGLGLYIVKEAINKLNGTIEIYSALRQGSTFIITLPYSNASS